MIIKKEQWIKLVAIGGIPLDMKEEKAAINNSFEMSGFEMKSSKKYVPYCLAYAAITGLSWSEATSYLYPALNKETQSFYIAHTYRADCQLAYRQGQLRSLHAWAIREGDQVSVTSNEELPMVAQSSLSPSRGGIKGGIASGTLTCGSVVTASIDRAGIEKIMLNGSSTWSSVFIDEMIKKTAIWRVLNSLPNIQNVLNTNIANHCTPYYPDTDLKKVKTVKLLSKSIAKVIEKVSPEQQPSPNKTYSRNFISNGLVSDTPTLFQYLLG